MGAIKQTSLTSYEKLPATSGPECSLQAPNCCALRKKKPISNQRQSLQIVYISVVIFHSLLPPPLQHWKRP